MRIMIIKAHAKSRKLFKTQFFEFDSFPDLNMQHICFEYIRVTNSNKYVHIYRAFMRVKGIILQEYTFC